MDSDSYDEMHRFLHDGPATGDDTHERLLSGRLSPLDAPDHLRGVAAVFEAAAGPAAPQELARRSQVVAAATAEVLSSQPPLRPTPSRRRAMLSKVLTAKFAAAATAAAFGLGTAAAAATGSLPGQTSHANVHAATGLATASSNQPSGDTGHGKSGHGNSAHGNSAHTTDGTGIPPTGPANSHAQFGLCTAFLAAGAHQSGTSGGSTPSTPPNASHTSPSNPPQYNSTAFKALIAQNKTVADTTTYCQGIVAAHSTSSDSTDSTDTSEPADTGKPAGVGQPAGAGQSSDTHPSTAKPAGTPPATAGSSQDHAPVTTPDSGGTPTAGTASGGASSSGTSTADQASGGTATAGSGNAGTHP